MKTWKAKYKGPGLDRNGSPGHEFYKKDGGTNVYTSDLSLEGSDGEWFEITVDENNGWKLTEAKKLPAGGGGRGGNWKSQPYHPETFVSNVVGSAIAAGVIKEPGQLKPWCVEAWKLIKGMQGSKSEAPTQQAQHQPQPVTVMSQDDLDQDIPF